MGIDIHAGKILTFDGFGTVIDNGRILIDKNGRISEVIPEEQVPVPGPPGCGQMNTIINATDKIVMPGLVNAHTHAAFYLLRGLGMDLCLLDWLKEYIWPSFMAMTPEDVYWGSLLGYIENLKSGVTSVIDNFYSTADHSEYIDEVFRAFKDSGLKGVIVRGYHDKPGMIPDEFIEEPDVIVNEAARLAGLSKEDIEIWTCPVNILFSEMATVERVAEVMRSAGFGCHTHVAESKSEVHIMREIHGTSYIRKLRDIGLLGPDFHSVHSVWIEDEEIDALSSAGSAFIHCPTSNMVLASGIAPIPKVLKRGVKVALGTDSLNRQDMFEVVKYAAFLSKASTNDPRCISAYDALEMAIKGGARTLGREKDIGSIEVGKRADIVIIDPYKVNTQPVYDVFSTIAYSASPINVSEVIIDGRLVVEGGELRGLDENEILGHVKTLGERLHRRALSPA